jgi:hypothetical protein
MNRFLTASLFTLFALSAGCDSKGSADGVASGKPTADSTVAGTGSAAAKSPADAPKKKSAAVGFCLGADGTSQDCGIACKVDKDPDCCAKWAELTKKICAKISKAECQSICDKDENPTACEIVKTMK